MVVEGVEKPGNLGAVLRTADGAGADAVIAADPRTDLFNPNAIRASLGTIFTVPVVSATSADGRAPGCPPRHPGRRGDRRGAATAHRGRPHAGRSRSSSAARPTASGRPGVTDAVDGVSIPMRGVADSLNVSVAAAVLLYEAGRQRTGHRLSRQTEPMEPFDFVIIGAGPAGEAAAYEARARGATVAIIDRRWFGGSCPHIGCLPSKSLLHGAAEHAANPASYSWERASAARDYMVNRPADAAEPDDSSHVRRLEDAGAVVLPRHRPDRRSRARRGPPRRRGPRAPGRERRRRRRLAVAKVPPLDGPRRRPRSGRTARRRSPASCRRACSSSAAARPAASWPRSTSGSACR